MNTVALADRKHYWPFAFSSHNHYNRCCRQHSRYREAGHTNRLDWPDCSATIVYYSFQ
jgi:hypothetical protein